MIHQLDGNLYVELRINGLPVPDVGNFYEHMIMTEGNGQLVPSCKITLHDEASLLVDELSLTEANRFSITVGVNGSSLLYTRNYRLFGNQNKNPYQGPRIHAVGILDVPNFYAENATAFYEGTSDAAMAKLAGEGGLKYSGPQGGTNDRQDTWLLVTKTRAAYMNEIARHGRVNDLSFMGAGVTSLGELRYKNITDVFRGSPKAKLVHNRKEEGALTVKDAKDTSTAGMSDTWGNYGMKRREHKLNGEHITHKSMPVAKTSPWLPVNADVSGKVNKRSRMDYMLLDCQNQHDKYWQAYYQNQRKMALMSEKMSVLIAYPTPLQLFDLVTYKQANAVDTKDVKQTDLYMVLGKSVVIKGGTHYAERIELGRYTLTKNGNTPLE